MSAPANDPHRDHWVAPRVPQGWQLVPVEPTAAMIAAANRLPENFPPMKRVYAAMLAAAPQPEGGAS